MIKEIVISFASIMAFLLLFAGVSFADSNGVWLNAMDVRGGSSSPQFFGADEPSFQEFGFRSERLTIGEANDAIINFGSNWKVGVEGSSFVIGSAGTPHLTVSSSEVRSSQSLVAGTVLRTNVIRPREGSNVVVILG